MKETPMGWVVGTVLVALSFIANLTLSAAYFDPAIAAEQSQMSEGELHLLFPGEFHVVVNGLLEVQVTASEDGSLFARQTGKSDSGRWEIRSGQLCITFSKWLKNTTHCADVIDDGGWYRTSNLAFQKK
jgi:hypothetical protein